MVSADGAPPGGGRERIDFFISYTGVDEAWATWIGEVLEAEGAVVRLQVWDSPTGDNFVVWISEQMAIAERSIAVCSPSYFRSHWCTQEWTGALAKRKIVPLRVAECDVPDVLSTIAYRDLFGVDDEAIARLRLLEAVGRTEVARRSGGFPGRASAPVEASFPGRLPTVFNLPSRNLNFTGRRELLMRVRSDLGDGGPVAVTALHGMGGVGKSQLAIEYAHRYAADYELVWWIDAEQASLVGEQLAALGVELGLPAGGPVAAVAAEVLKLLRRRDGWLLVFDNAEDPASLQPWISDGPGHTLITSRHHHWAPLGRQVELDVFTRDESVALLTRRVPGIDPFVADAVADELGDLPLGLEQAAAYIGTTGMSTADYLSRFRNRRASMLHKGVDLIYKGTIETAWSLALDQLRATAPAALQLMELSAQLAPEPIPLALFRDHPELLRPPLQNVVRSDDLDDTIADVLRYSLARRDDDTIRVHRLLSAVIRAHQPDDLAPASVQALLVAHQPRQRPEDPSTWPTWAVLTPHIVNAPATDPAADLDDDTRNMLVDAGWALYLRGDIRTSRTFNGALYKQFKATLGNDHEDTQRAGISLASELSRSGDHRAAREINEEIRDRRRRMLGEGHHLVLGSAHNLAIELAALGDHEAARELNEDTLARRRRVLGEDHPDTLNSAHNLAIEVAALGDHEAARELFEDTLGRQRRVLGEDHPRTLSSAHSLAIEAVALGDGQTARALFVDTLARRRRVLGEDHPDTLSSAHNLAIEVAAFGDHRGACELTEDTLARRRRVLGEDHPLTLNSAHSLAVMLVALGDGLTARELNQDTLARRRRVLGEDHPHTLRSLSLANELAEPGDF